MNVCTAASSAGPHCIKKHFSLIIEKGAAPCQEAQAAGAAAEGVSRLRVELFGHAALAPTAFLLCQDLRVGIRRRPVLNSTAE